MEFYQDWKELLESLNRHRVKYALVGGLALAQHGHPRYTKDMGILVQSTSANAARLMKAMEAFGFGNVGIVEEDFLRPGYFIQLGYEPVRIDLITSIPGVTWDEVEDNLMDGDFDGVPVPVIGRREFIKAKRASGRPEDIVDLKKLGEKP